LLVDNGLGQAVKLWLAKFHAAWTDAVDDGAQDRVGFLEMADCGAHSLLI
jgi:hypothetical protein